jgi:hypothetical protein
LVDGLILRTVVSGAELANTRTEVGPNSILSVQSDLVDLTHIISLFSELVHVLENVAYVIDNHAQEFENPRAGGILLIFLAINQKITSQPMDPSRSFLTVFGIRPEIAFRRKIPTPEDNLNVLAREVPRNPERTLVRLQACIVRAGSRGSILDP